MNTQLTTTNFRMQQWRGLISARIQSGQNVRDWCDANGISYKSYYYWLRKIKAAMSEEDGVPSVSSFAELPAPQKVRRDFDNKTFHPEMTITLGDITIGIDSSTSAELLSSVLQVVRNA